MTDHTPRREERGNALTFIRYCCSCGYTSAWSAYPGHAEQAWLQHCAAKAEGSR